MKRAAHTYSLYSLLVKTNVKNLKPFLSMTVYTVQAYEPF